MARRLLASYGIEAVATGENASNAYSLPAIEGPQMHVPESPAREAGAIIPRA
jgi:hypothetical protein